MRACCPAAVEVLESARPEGSVQGSCLDILPGEGPVELGLEALLLLGGEVLAWLLAS